MISARRHSAMTADRTGWHSSILHSAVYDSIISRQHWFVIL